MYVYELWNGKEVVGFYRVLLPLQGKELYVPEFSMLKEPYGASRSVIKVPITWRIISRTHCDVTFRTVLDVRRKSARQIEILRSS